MAVKDEEIVLDPDELLEEEQPKTEEENPSFQFTDPDDGFEIVDEDSYTPPEPEPDEKQTQMQQQFEQMQQQLQMMQMQNQPQKEQSQLADVLKQMQENFSKPAEREKPQIDFKKKRTEWMEQFFDKPVETMDDYTQTNIAPAFMQMQSEISALKQQLAKQNISSDPHLKKVMDKYGAEVETYAKSFKDDPEAYKKAASMVGMQHFSELLEEEKTAALEGMTETKEPKKPVSYTGTERQPNPQKKIQKKTIVLKPHEKREFERQFAVSPISSRKKFYEMKWVPNHRA